MAFPSSDAYGFVDRFLILLIHHSTPGMTAILCFSKDRPWQLANFLHSLEPTLNDNQLTLILILYAPGMYRDQYEALFRRQPPCVVAIEEKDSFADALLQCMDLFQQSLQHDGILTFAVDDLVFLSTAVDFQHYGILLREKPTEMVGFHLKLHPGIAYSHAASQICTPPVLSYNPLKNSSSTAIKHLEYNFPSSTSDWKYVIDFCGGLYRLEDISFLIDQCIVRYGRDSIRNPNVLEYSLNRVFWECRERGESHLPNKVGVTSSSVVPSSSTGVLVSTLEQQQQQQQQQQQETILSRIKQYSLSACSACPLLKVITINRVQNTYKVPIFNTPGGDLNTLNKMCDDGTSTSMSTILDIDAYTREINVSVHVGALHLITTPQSQPLSQSQPQQQPQPSSLVNVSVLLPVYNGEKYLEQCLYSILLTPQHCGSFEIVMVDDGSTDGTFDIGSRIAAIVNGCSGSNNDSNSSSTDSPTIADLKRQIHQSNPQVSMKVLSLSHMGLAHALDEGLQLCQADYVARIDVDDLCEEGRLGKQYRYLQKNPKIVVVGGQAVVIQEDVPGTTTASSSSSCSSPSSSSGCLAAGIPTHPVLVHTTISFRCALLHPTVMFRKHIVLACGGYTNKNCDLEGGNKDTQSTPDVTSHPTVIDTIEDYNLWLRILAVYPCSIANLGDVLIRLRVHDQSKSASSRTSLTDMSQQVRWDYISKHVLPSLPPSSSSSSSSSPPSVDKAVYDALMYPNKYMKSDRDFQAAMKLLSCLYESLISRLLSCYYSPSAVVTPATDATDSGVSVEEMIPEGTATTSDFATKEKDAHDQFILDEEQPIITALLIDMKRNFAKKLYRFAVSAGSKSGNQPPKEEWKAMYTNDDIAFIVKTDAIDAIQRLVLSSGF